MTYATTRFSTRTGARPKPMNGQNRAVTLARALNRLEREHVALLLAISELESATSGQGQQDSALRAALLPLLRGDLRRTQYALRRADAGQYGACDGCGGVIAMRRLALNPATTRCSTCETVARA